MIVYAIRHKPSGLFLPQPKGRTGSRVEPKENCIPRLFHEKRVAKGYLTVWLQGIVVAGRYQTYDGDWEEDLNVVPQPHRRREDMEIVDVHLTIKEQHNGQR